MKNIKLIGLDLDGTMLTPQKELSPRVEAAIARAIAAGVVVLPATGRALHGIPKSIFAIPGMRYALTSNGAMLYDLAANRILLSDCFSKKTALDVLNICDYLQLRATAVFIGGTAYSDTLEVSELNGMYSEEVLRHLRTTRIKVLSLHDLVEGAEDPIEKYSLVFSSMATRTRALELFSRRDDCKTTSSMEHNLELNTPTANKGAALLALGEMLGIGKEQIMAIGDSPNDMAMLQMVGHPVAMANAVPQVLAAVPNHTASNKEDGVALAIEALLD